MQFPMSFVLNVASMSWWRYRVDDCGVVRACTIWRGNRINRLSTILALLTFLTPLPYSTPRPLSPSILLIPRQPIESKPPRTKLHSRNERDGEGFQDEDHRVCCFD
jgi:hypothetical protein